jgi:hypothetical protein
MYEKQKKQDTSGYQIQPIVAPETGHIKPKEVHKNPHRHVTPPSRGHLRRRRQLLISSTSSVGAVQGGPLEQNEVISAGSGSGGGGSGGGGRARGGGDGDPLLTPLPDGPSERRRGAVTGWGAT